MTLNLLVRLFLRFNGAGLHETALVYGYASLRGCILTFAFVPSRCKQLLAINRLAFITGGSALYLGLLMLMLLLRQRVNAASPKSTAPRATSVSPSTNDNTLNGSPITNVTSCPRCQMQNTK
uniref:Uncharacterized protein n=1 Tax=Glossina austeni TaxID=7395 RepID=A0A1A9UZ77_GLOAU